MKKMKEKDVVKLLKGYEELEKKAEEVLIAGEFRFEGINSVTLEDGEDEIGICYWLSCRGETFDEYEIVPVSFFAEGTDLKAEWEKLKAKRLEKETRAERAARRAEARAEKRRELAELRRLKKKYPDA